MPNAVLNHKLLRKSLRLLAVLVAAVFLLLLYVALVGISIDASVLRGDIANMFKQSLGREVHFDGPLQLEISARPKLRAGGLHIANAAGFSGGEFASMGEARLALDLWPLLSRHLQIEELAGSDVRIRLQLNKNGSNNWTFKASNSQPVGPQPSSSMDLDSVLTMLDIKRVSLEKLDVEFIGANEHSHFFELQSLVAHFPAGQAVTLALNGTVEKIYPYKLDFTGGSIADLVHRDKPWPIDMKLAFMSSRLSLNGSVSSNSGNINFGLGTENLNEFERLLQTKLPAVGVAGISGDLKYAPGQIALSNLNGVMGQTLLSGVLNVEYGGARPKIQGELTVPVLDLRPFMTGKATTQSEPPQNLAEVYRELANATFNLSELNSADADLTLRVGQWLSLPGNVHDAMLQVKLEQGRLSVPVQATVADVALSGSAAVDARAAPARFKLTLGTHDSSLGNLAGVLFGMPDVQGQLGRFNLRIEATGDRGSELMDSLDVKLELERGKLSYGNAAGERPVRFSLDSFVFALPAGKPLRGEVRGALLDKPFSAALHGGALAAMMREGRAPIDFILQAGSAKAQMHALLQASSENPASDIAFELTAPHSGEVANWFGLKSGTDAPVSLQGKVHAEKTNWHLSDFALHLGRSALTADMSRTQENGKPLLKLQLAGDLVDVGELQSLLPVAQEKTSAQTEKGSGAMIDIPILPGGINLAEADIQVRLKRIASTTPFSVHDLSFDGRMRDGLMQASPFSVNVAETNFSGAIQLDLRTRQPSAGVWLAADGMDIGRVLDKLGIVRSFDADVDHLRLHLDLHSSRLGELLTHSELAANFDGGHFTLRDANTGGKLRVVLDNGELVSAAGTPVRLGLNGSLDGVPVYITLKTAKAVDLINPNLPIPFKVIASTSGASIQLAGDIDRPFTQKDIELALDMSGVRFDNLNALAHADLPPWGPWSASGKFHMTPSGYEVSDLSLQVGNSLLGGNGKLDTKVVPPRLDVTLTAPAIQLDDFKSGDWSAEKAKPAEPVKTKSQEALRKQTAEASDHAQQLLSHEVLSRQDAYLKVRVDQVLSGKDVLGSGKLDAQLKNGRAEIGPVIVNAPGGSASLWLGYEPGDKDVAVNLRTEVKRFDYGVLARRLDAKSEMRGTFNLDVDVSARAQYLSEVLRYGKGHIDFAVWPENMKSGLLDVWAVNVLMALLPVVDSSNESKVNCAIGRFVLNDGKLSEKDILIDTSRMRVTGTGGADFATEKIQLYVQPHAKTPQFLSIAIPIELSGTFNDFHVGVRARDVAGSVGQLVTSVVWVPLQMMFGKSIPADGRDVCRNAELK